MLFRSEPRAEARILAIFNLHARAVVGLGRLSSVDLELDPTVGFSQSRHCRFHILELDLGQNQTIATEVVHADLGPLTRHDPHHEVVEQELFGTSHLSRGRGVTSVGLVVVDLEYTILPTREHVDVAHEHSVIAELVVPLGVLYELTILRLGDEKRM